LNNVDLPTLGRPTKATTGSMIFLSKQTKAAQNVYSDRFLIFNVSH